MPPKKPAADAPSGSKKPAGPYTGLYWPCACNGAAMQSPLTGEIQKIHPVNIACPIRRNPFRIECVCGSKTDFGERWHEHVGMSLEWCLQAGYLVC